MDVYRRKTESKGGEMRVSEGPQCCFIPGFGSIRPMDGERQRDRPAGRFFFTVSTVLERIATPDDRRDGLDIADYLIRQIQTQSNAPVSFAPLTREEEILQQMNAKNPAIMQLITSLGLVSTSTGKQIRTA